MFEEFDLVVLVNDISKYHLQAGDIGTVVHFYEDKKAVEVEFVAASGKTVALLTLSPTEIRPIAKNEIFHVRGVAAV